MELIAATEQYFKDQISEFFLEGLKKSEKVSIKQVELQGK